MRLWLEAFSPEELHPFFERQFGPDVAKELPSPLVPHIHLAFEANRVLEQRRLIDEHLIRTLLNVLPGHRRLIAKWALDHGMPVETIDNLIEDLGGQMLQPDSHLTISSLVVKSDRSRDRIDVVLRNRAHAAVIVSKVAVHLLDSAMILGISSTRILRPLSTWVIHLEHWQGTHLHHAKEPLFIAPDDAAMVTLALVSEISPGRIFTTSKALSRVGEFKLQLEFSDDLGGRAVSRIFTIPS